MVEDDAATIATFAAVSPSRAVQACSHAAEILEDVRSPAAMDMLTALEGLDIACARTNA